MIAAKIEQCVLVKTASEIAIKSPPVRQFFTKKLLRNIRFALRRNSVKCEKIIRGGGRLYLFCGNAKKAQKVLLLVPGIHAAALAAHFEGVGYAAIESAVVSSAKKHLKKGDSFALDVTVANNRDFSASDLERRLGAAVQREIAGLKVKLKQPEKEVCVEIGKKDFFIYAGQQPGIAGLPIGVEGNVALLMGGTNRDLPAAFLMMRRGCNVFPVAKKRGRKIENLLEKIVPLNNFRRFVVTERENLPALIRERNIKALVTSDSKVDSASLRSYSKFDAIQHLVVLRPLLLYPKELEKKLRLLFH
ncbi:MAG: THUMP domain-containing protein [Candidatus Diapherotrites archaeon]|nr:THUMP domain-containing protein [Candidatus Diapherotrites archaeon]